MQTKQELEKLTVKALRGIASQSSVPLTGITKKADIVDAIVKAAKPATAPTPKAAKVTPKKAPAKKTTVKKPAAKKTPAKKKAAAPIKAPTPTSTPAAKEKETAPAPKTLKADPIEKTVLSTQGRKTSKFENIDQSIVEQAAKFYIAKEEPIYKSETPSFIPEKFMSSNVKLIVRDPETLFVYWHVSEQAVNDARGKLISREGLSMTLRILQVNNGSFYETDIPAGVSNRYIESAYNDCPVKAQLCYINAMGEFSLIAESNVTYVPARHEEQKAQEEATKPENALYAMSLGVSEEEVETMKASGYERFHVGSEEFLKQKLQQQVSSHLNSSVSSAGVAEEGNDRKFRLWVDAELIVYGETEPDATLTVGGDKIDLNPDGSFSFRVAFPDGNIPFPIKAESSDGIEERAIDLLFDRNTVVFPPRLK